MKTQEPTEIGYRECSDALLKMWMDEVLTDGEYNRISDRLNKQWAKRIWNRPSSKKEGVTPNQ